LKPFEHGNRKGVEITPGFLGISAEIFIDLLAFFRGRELHRVFELIDLFILLSFIVEILLKWYSLIILRNLI
jgi:hypothetical protein